MPGLFLRYRPLLSFFRRRVLDDDQREVRILQELLLEDGEFHSDGPGRERKFRWKNMSKGAAVLSVPVDVALSHPHKLFVLYVL